MDKIFNIIPHQVVAYIISLAMAIALARFLIPLLKRNKCGQPQREEGPASHKVKRNSDLWWTAVFDTSGSGGRVVCTEGSSHPGPDTGDPGFGLIGFLDDYLKVVKNITPG